MPTLLHILNFLFVLLEVIVLFNAIIIVHEWGHFLAARWRGLKIEEFGVWFGKPLWKKEIGGVVYSLGTIPAGGFVKLPQLAPMDLIEGETDTPRETLPNISALDKIIVAFAGPLFSFLLAIVLACGVWFVGKPVSDFEKTTTIGYVEPGSPAEVAGLKAGDKILEVDGHKVKRFLGMINSVNWFVVRSEGEKIPFTVERDGKVLTVDSGWTMEKRKSWQRAGLREVHILPAQPTRIKEVEPGSPAAEAGLKPGDVISAVNGARIFTPGLLTEAISKAPGQPIALTINRAGAPLDFTIQPKPLSFQGDAPKPRIGILWDFDISLEHPTPTQQIVDSVSSIGNMVGALFSPKSGVKAQHFSGPVGIGRLYYQMFESEHGWRMALAFSVFLNVNLAILNLLPFPILDGGHIVLAVIETIRRKPVSLLVLEKIQGLCGLLLFAFILYVTFFDIQDLPWRRLTSQKEVPAAVEK
ncbi:MAG: RIP metalloprotease RseP [Chthoniobacteraceae bacterium]